jgi:hypothetical protein
MPSPKPLQNLRVKFAIDGLTRGMNSSWAILWMSKKIYQYQRGLDISAKLLSLRVINIHPYFITGYDIGDEVGVVSGLCFSFLQPEKRWAFW